MKWSWKIGAFAGIAVYMHATFLLLLGWIALSHWMQCQSLLPTLLGVGFILALFLCVVLHEYGHALAARKFGIVTKDITLLPIGGLARLECIPDKPNQELWVALAGPAVNVVIAALLWMYLILTGHFQPVQQMGLTHGAFLERVMFANLFLVGFNMIPAFPMDVVGFSGRSSPSEWNMQAPRGWRPVSARDWRSYSDFSVSSRIPSWFSSLCLFGSAQHRRLPWRKQSRSWAPLLQETR